MSDITQVIEKGVKAHTEGDLQTAVNAYQAALEMDNNHATVHNNLGFLYGQMGQWQKAEFHLQEAVRLDPDMAVAFANLGQVLAALGQAEAAVTHLHKAVELEPGNADHWHNLARICFALNDFENAEYGWHRALGIQGNNIDYMVKMATAMVAQQRYDEAHRVFDAAINMNPEYQQAWAQKGVALFLEQNYGLCKKCLGRALALDPSDYTTLKHLALVYIACGENQTAMDYMYTLCEQFPGEASLACDLAVMELSAGEKLSARERLGELVKDSRDSRTLYYFAVSLKETGGDYEQIKQLLAEVQSRNDEYSHRATESLRSLMAN